MGDHGPLGNCGPLNHQFILRLWNSFLKNITDTFRATWRALDCRLAIYDYCLIQCLFLLPFTCQGQLDFTSTCSLGILFDGVLTCLSCEVWICQDHSLPKLKIVVCVLEWQCPSAAHTGTFLAFSPSTVPNGQLPWFLVSFDGFSLRPGSGPVTYRLKKGGPVWASRDRGFPGPASRMQFVTQWAKLID